MAPRVESAPGITGRLWEIVGDCGIEIKSEIEAEIERKILGWSIRSKKIEERNLQVLG